ncbi:MAG: alpha-galactosidase [Treponema sp.]|jgi:alpha-galactosidase|nr:alpha-galactosidase [Treponema sp.]
MPFFFHEKDSLLHLQSAPTSYVLKIYPSGLIGNVYWGQGLSEPQDLSSLVCLRDMRNAEDPASVDYENVEDSLYQEYPSGGGSDFRPPAFRVVNPDGSVISCLRYHSHRVTPGKPALPGLPALWCSRQEEADTLTVRLEDGLTGLSVDLLYTMFADTGALVRSVRFFNGGQEACFLTRAFSLSCDLPPGEFDSIHLAGSWARERHIVRQPLKGGAHLIESSRGVSSHQQNPFIALAEPSAGEERGLVYGFNLVYSGSFSALAVRDQFGSTRVLMGLNPETFSWKLEAGESFQTPECVMVFSHRGLGGLSRTFHRLYQNNLIRGQDRERPVLINNWEATYFNFTADKILDMAREAAALGIELFVLDDGWFGRRDSDNSSLGDWFEDRRKLPEGLKDLAVKIRETGLQFGLWFEPEMVSPDSRLYREHPDWHLHVKGRRGTEIRNQFVLDLTRAEVREAVIRMVSAVLTEVPVSYVKWDMNRPLTEAGSPALPPDRQRETSHRYVLGVYEMMERLVSAFPDVLFEGCAGGGGRFDPGILYYMPQIWTSDNSDAIERLKIQYATSLAYPLSSMGAHVSAVPNHQCGRITPLETRGNVAMSGIFGYEIDLGALSAEEKDTLRRQIAFYKERRRLIQTGDLYRLKSPFKDDRNDGNETAWIVVSPGKDCALAFYARTLGVPNPGLTVLKLAGLDGGFTYRVTGKTSYTARGEVLMQAGIRLPSLWGDFQSCLWGLQKV